MLRLLASLFLLGTLPAFAGSIDQYESRLKLAIEAINKKEPRQQIVEHAKALMNLSAPLIQEVVKVRPECDAYLKKANAVKDLLPKLSIDKIESDFHKDGALPKAADYCYHAKDLVVHPATALIIARDITADQEAYPKMLTELAEVLGHLQGVKNSLNKK